MSQERLAGLARVTVATVRNAERGRVLQCPVGPLLRIASALDVTLADLFPLFESAGRRKRRAKQTGVADNTVVR